FASSIRRSQNRTSKRQCRSNASSRLPLIEQPPEQIRFVVDENFPETIVPFVELHVPQVELVLWKQVDPRLESLEDDRLILALYQSGYGSLVTLNYRMLNFLNVLARIRQTQFALVALEDAGEMPIRAAGLLLYNLPQIV